MRQIGQNVLADDPPVRDPERTRRLHIIRLPQFQRLAARDPAETDPAGTPSAMQTCSVPVPSTMIRAISSSRLGIEASTRHDEKHHIVDPAADRTRRNAEEQRNGMTIRLVSPPISKATRTPFRVR